MFPAMAVPSNRWVLAGVLAIAAATLVSYLPVLRAGFVWDDDNCVTGNAALADARGLVRIWLRPGVFQQYYPVVQTSHWIERRLWGLDPAGYHAVNIVLHALNALLLWAVLRKLRVPGAFVAAAVFALHPVQVESVAWITERKNTLSGLFYFASLLAYLRYAGLDGGARRENSPAYPAAMLFFVLALFSKTVTATLPAAILLMVWWKRGRVGWDDVRPLVPFFMVGAALGLITAWMERVHVGARGAAWDLSFLDRVLIAGRALWFYSDKVLWPSKLTFIYPRWAVDAGVWWQYLFPAGALAVVAALWLLRGTIGRGPVAAVLVFAVTLFPALGFLNFYPMQYSFVADHFQYLACAAIIALAVAAGATFVTDPRARQYGSVGLLAGLALMTWQRGRVYRDAETLWRDTLSRNPSAWMAHVNLGKIYSLRGESAPAMAHYEQAIALRPDDAGAHNNLALELLRTGDVEAAVQHFNEAVRLWPNYPDAYFHLGLALEQRGWTNEAVRAFELALLSRPAYPEALNALGVAMARRRENDKAIALFLKACEIAPDYVDARINLCRVLRISGQLEAAGRHGELAVRMRPDSADASYQLALVRIAQGRLSDAQELLRASLALDPQSSYSHYQLALTLLEQGNAGDALENAREAIRLWPENVDALNLLAWVLSTHPDAAIRDAPEALRFAAAACQITQRRIPNYLDTLAAAQGNAGDFAAARQTAQEALALVGQGHGAKALKRDISARLALYASGKPYREKPGR